MKYNYNVGDPVIIKSNPNLKGVEFARYLEVEGELKVQVLLPRGNDMETPNVRMYDVLEVNQIMPVNNKD